MQRSKVMGTFFTLVLFGGLALAPSGCSNDDSFASSPDVGLPGSGYDGYPPACPTGLEVLKATPDGFKLGWIANSEDDLAGYRVYVYDPSPYRDDSYVCAHGYQLIDADDVWYLYDHDISEGVHYFRLSAVDHDGNESPRCAPLEFWYDGAPAYDSELEGGDSDKCQRPQGAGIPEPPIHGQDAEQDGSGQD